MPVVLTETRDRAFVVTINRPDVRNCVDGETAGLLFEAVETFRADAVRFPVSSQSEQRLQSGLHAQCGPHFHEEVGLVIRIVPQRMRNGWGKNRSLTGADIAFLPAQAVAYQA